MPEPGALESVAAEGTSEMTLLEQRYRRWLRLLPKDYREQWEEDMVDTFLAGALRGTDEDRVVASFGSPQLGEVASVIALALKLRLLHFTIARSEAAPVQDGWPAAWRTAWSRVALIGLLVNTIWFTVSVPLTLWHRDKLPGLAPLLSSPEEIEAAYVDPVLNSRVVLFGWLFNAHWLALALPLAFLALLFGYRRAAALLAVAGVLPRTVDLMRSWSNDPGDDFIYLSYLGFAVFPVLALLAYVGTPLPVRRRPWLWSWLAGVVVLSVLATIVWQSAPEVLLDPVGLYCLGLALAALVYVPWLVTFGQRPDRGWCLTLAIVAVIALQARIAAVLPLWFGADEMPADQRAVWQWWLDSILLEALLAAAAAVTFIALAVLYAVPRAVFLFDDEEDLLVFASVDEATEWMDAADVEAGAYPDSYLDDGTVLQPAVSGVGTSEEAIALLVTERVDRAELAVRLLDYSERTAGAPTTADPREFARQWLLQEERAYRSGKRGVLAGQPSGAAPQPPAEDG